MKIVTQTKHKFVILSHHGFADILLNKTTGEKSLHSVQEFFENDVVDLFSPETIVNIPTYLTVQISLHHHITLNPFYLQFINHSCNPNVFFNTVTFKLTALRKIEVGDELTFFYPSTEWDMVQAFACTCNNNNCLQTIKGASYITKEVLTTYQLTDFISSMINK